MARKSKTVLTTIPDVARHFGVRPRIVSEWFEQGCPRRKQPGYKNAYLYVAEDIQAWREARDPTDTDPAMTGATSPALERWRDARAKLSELDLAERQGRLIDTDDMYDRAGRFAARLRRAGEVLQRMCGAEAYAVLIEAIDDAEREFFPAAIGRSGQGPEQDQPLADDGNSNTHPIGD